MEKLAEGLQKLDEDSLLLVVQMIHDNKTESTYVKNDVEREFYSTQFDTPLVHSTNLVQRENSTLTYIRYPNPYRKTYGNSCRKRGCTR